MTIAAATREASEAVVVPMAEAELAHWRREQGGHVVRQGPRYWEQIRPGFYQPIHWLARLTAKQATCPSRAYWGFRASLAESDRWAANGSVPVHVLSDVAGYDLQRLTAQRRYHIRKSHRLAHIVQVVDPALLRSQGYEVLVSAMTRGAYAKVPPREQSVARFSGLIHPSGSRLVLAGLFGERVGAYLAGYAVDATAYIAEIHVATDVLTSQIGSGLVFEFVQACRRSGAIHEIVYGQHSREDPALVTYKDGMAFPVQYVPAKVSINPLVGRFIRWRHPHVYYRLTGRA